MIFKFAAPEPWAQEANPNAMKPGDPARRGTPAGITHALSQRLAATFRSGQTPAFAQRAGKWFEQANPEQRADMLNHLLGSMGRTQLAEAPDSAGGQVAALLSRLNAGALPGVAPHHAAMLSADQVTALAALAEQRNPSVVERMSACFAKHPKVLDVNGHTALAATWVKVAEHFKP